MGERAYAQGFEPATAWVANGKIALRSIYNAGCRASHAQRGACNPSMMRAAARPDITGRCLT